jgi:hypothetical protein
LLEEDIPININAYYLIISYYNYMNHNLLLFFTIHFIVIFFISGILINISDYAGTVDIQGTPFIDSNNNPVKWYSYLHYKHSLSVMFLLIIFLILYLYFIIEPTITYFDRLKYF